MENIDKKRGRPRSDQAKLSKEILLSCANELLQGSGKVPSIRKIARKLDVDPMAIYHYFPSKSALLEGVTVRLMEGIYIPQSEDTWEEQLRFLCSSYLDLLKNYSGLLETFLSMSVKGPAQVFIARFNTIVAPLGLPEDDMKNSLDLLVDYLHGFALSIHCAPKKDSLTLDSLNGPLNFYIKALTANMIRSKIFIH